ncbi:hypothetical protein [Dyadobacter sp. CY312]|uniref:hypothetical protein n=1 Tax=Dyadobacter sp. CY312 TaxID=2907303 RepID=UPI001F46655E|nr:hypothetical protein [Dyadobacter sp. CY312]MCE7040514.1 hypothetical protein [Dyadobacter sp. CY312]
MKTTIKLFAIAVFVSAFFSCEQPAEIAPVDVQIVNTNTHTTDPRVPEVANQEIKTNQPQIQ